MILAYYCKRLTEIPQGRGLREDRDTVESWSRGVEPFFLVDRLCLWFIICFEVGLPALCCKITTNL
jgi:hypothetical protein